MLCGNTEVDNENIDFHNDDVMQGFNNDSFIGNILVDHALQCFLKCKTKDWHWIIWLWCGDIWDGTWTIVAINGSLLAQFVHILHI